MRYRKFRADQLFSGRELLDSDKVLIIDEKGRVENIAGLDEAGEEVEKLNGILTPGFVNCHCHLELSHMKNKIAEKSGLIDFVYKVVSERNSDEDEIEEAIRDAEAEMKNNGTVATGDICNNTSTIPQKKQNNLHYYNFIESSGWLPDVAAIRFDRAFQLHEQFRLQNPESGCSIVPHASYSVSENLWKQIQPFFRDKVVTIHNQETAFEDQFFLEGKGDFNRMYEMMKIDNSHHQPTKKSSLQSYFDKLIAAKNILLVHNTFTRQEDIDFIKTKIKNTKANVFFCLCVNANLYIENNLPPVEMLMKNQCRIVLGTDSLASNWSLSILDEIKTIVKNFPSIPLEKILGWATLGGAEALDMQDTLGSFDKGKIPGVNLIDTGYWTVSNRIKHPTL